MITLYKPPACSYLQQALLSLVMLVLTATSYAESDQGPVSKNPVDKVAIGGYDSVRYHDPDAIADHRADPGSDQWIHEWRGAKWRFASEASYAKFRANPAQYQPAFGGFCANALRLGEGLIRTDGSHWEIFDGQLYLFFAARGRDQWLDGDHTQYRDQASKAWTDITGMKQ